MELKTAQLRVSRKAIIAEGCEGTIFWATPSRAKLLIAAGAAMLVNAEAVGPAEAPTAGPTEKKSFAVDQVGPSTDSASSTPSAPAAPSSSSEVDQASPLTSAQPLSKRTRARAPRSGQ